MQDWPIYSSDLMWRFSGNWSWWHKWTTGKAVTTHNPKKCHKMFVFGSSTKKIFFSKVKKRKIRVNVLIQRETFRFFEKSSSLICYKLFQIG